MINFFPQSRRMAIWGSLLGVIIGESVIWIFYNEQRTTKMILMILAFILIINAFLYVARIIAMRKYQKMLLDLYEKIEIKTFLESAVPLLDKKVSAASYVTHAVHVANAYLALGDARKAIDLLEKQKLPERELELRGIVFSNLGTAYLQLGDAKNAEKVLKQLIQVVENPKCKKDFRQKAKNIITYQKICADSLHGKKGKKEILEKDYENANRPLHKINSGRFLIKLYDQMGEIERAEKIQKDMESVWNLG